jgi:hypothetical protein
VQAGQGESGRVLSPSASGAGSGSAHGLAECPAADRAGVCKLRLAADDAGAEAARLDLNHIVI